MATLGSYYIDSTDFTTATGVYTDIDLTIAAPAGYYQTCGVWRLQTVLPTGPVLGPPQSCPYCDDGDCAVDPANGWNADQQGVVDLDIDIGTGIGVYHVTLKPDGGLMVLTLELLLTLQHGISLQALHFKWQT